MSDEISLGVDVAGIAMKNPVMTASGTCGYGIELAGFVDLSRLGALVLKGVSVNPMPGNPPPRIVETAGGMLNAIGLQNVGMHRLMEEYLPQLEGYRIPVIANILGTRLEEYCLLAAALGSHPVIKALEVNVSCPNVKKGGIAFGSDPEALGDLVRHLRRETDTPLIVKLTPNVTDIVCLAQSAEEAGADAVSLINTVLGMAVDAKRRRPVLAHIVGGLSGPAVKPIALRMVWEVARKVSIPVIGVGGIMSGEDAIEFLLCGARAVQVGTAHFLDPGASVRIIEGIYEYLQEHSIQDVTSIIGGLETDGVGEEQRF
jgi:dihydroorotate dehydrogenase (NAD+) catalytic subunit